jgi:hypothetical protein
LAPTGSFWGENGSIDVLQIYISDNLPKLFRDH